MAAGLAQLSILKEHPEIYQQLDLIGTRFADGMRKIKEERIFPYVTKSGTI